MTTTNTKPGPVLLYDGVCGFCNKTIQTILKNDQKGTLRFAALQSDYGQSVIARHQELKSVDSVVWVESDGNGGEKVSIRSRAALKVMNYLGGIWKLFLVFYIVPAPIRDIFYNLIAKYRYRFFGKYDTCLLPDKQVRARFIDAG
ncbi:MAG TPA: DCC1-like thiol-disulfide oxidoreductase family protein [Blastocatellia bacterium]|nr:DCC1-like thiol-disulfide oxidoreductase family protein [Blastocatellia bacterium]